MNIFVHQSDFYFIALFTCREQFKTTTATDEEYFQALGTAYALEIQALYDAGCRNIAVDDPHLTYFCSSQFLGGCEKDGVDPDALLDLYLEAHNRFLRLRSGEDLYMGTHLCRGKMSGSTDWVTGSYDRIAEKLLTQTDYDTYYLEFDDAERTGGFECLQYLPRGKNVVLGLVSTKKAELENAEDLRRGIGQAAEWIAKGQGLSREEALESLSVSPQCGFSGSSLAGGQEYDHGENVGEARPGERQLALSSFARQIVVFDSPAGDVID